MSDDPASKDGLRDTIFTVACDLKARQWICRELETLMSSPQEIAEANGWDCFKEQA